MIATTQATTIQHLAKYMNSLLETRVRGKITQNRCEDCHFNFDSRRKKPRCPRCQSYDYVVIIGVVNPGKSIVWRKNNLSESDYELLKDLCWTAHNNGDIFSDNYRYEFISECLNAIQDNEDLDMILIEADCYMSNLTDWFASHPYRQRYMDEALAESEYNNAFDLLTYAQYLEKQEVLQSVITWLIGLLEELLEEL